MENKSYYAVIPANIRYDKRLKLLSRLLYGEITALCNDKGFCWASNKYFADLYDVSVTTISKSIKQLKDFGYIKSDIVYKEGTKEILNRYLKIVQDPIEENFNTPIEEKFKDNNTTNNNTTNNIEKKNIKKKRTFKKPTLKEIEDYIKEKNYSINANQFFEYYETSDWKDAVGNPVLNWKLKIVSWEHRNNKNNKRASNPVQSTVHYLTPEESAKEYEAEKDYWDRILKVGKYREC